jgi:mitogen-activated protein kinase 1/3
MWAKNRRNIRKVKVGWDVGPDYEIIRPLCAESQSSVCEAIQVATGETVAIRRVSGIFNDPVTFKGFLREISIMRYLDHPNIAKILAIIPPKSSESFDELFVVMEYAPSDLHKFIKSPITLSQDHVKLIFYNLLCGLQYMHTADILHLDLKPANILLYNDCDVKISGFGVSRSIHHSNQYTAHNSQGEENSNSSEKPSRASVFRHTITSNVGTKSYRAPELILLEKNYGKPIDIWSVGCILGELCSMINGNTPPSLTRQPLIRGAVCDPLSSKPRHYNGNQVEVKDWNQLSLIFELIGTPSIEELGFISHKSSVAYIRSLEIQKGKDLEDKYPYSNPTLTYIMKAMLQFDPRRRLRFKEAISHSYFDNVRSLDKEKEACSRLRFEFEENGEMACDELRHYLIRELPKYNK